MEKFQLSVYDNRGEIENFSTCGEISVSKNKQCVQLMEFYCNFWRFVAKSVFTLFCRKIYFATIRKQAMKEGRLASLEKASVLSMSDDPKDQDKARDALIDLIADDIFNDLMDRPGPHG